jgi:hypothetical protein
LLFGGRCVGQRRVGGGRDVFGRLKLRLVTGWLFILPGIWIVGEAGGISADGGLQRGVPGPSIGVRRHTARSWQRIRILVRRHMRVRLFGRLHRQTAVSFVRCSGGSVEVRWFCKRGRRRSGRDFWQWLLGAARLQWRLRRFLWRQLVRAVCRLVRHV